MFSHKTRALIFSVLFGLALLALPAHSATITTYTTASSWQAALSSFQTIDFEGLAPAGSGTAYPSGLTTSSVQFLGMNGNSMNSYSSIVVFDTSSSLYFNFGTGDAVYISTDRTNGSSPVPYIHITLPAPVTAVAFNLFTASPTALSYTVTLPVGTYSVPTYPMPAPAFWGITSDTPFSTVDLTLQGTTYNGGSRAFVDNFAFGAEQPSVPESSSCFLFGIGLTGIGFLRRRANHRTAKR
ncbi:MAG TPA: PEP-CTERM sorting domain-containing protein [Bryobacteraceae bacterium]|nr:PEP-CTERM sorting domain-containing protein [Bryobacteraceae bacterium]